MQAWYTRIGNAEGVHHVSHCTTSKCSRVLTEQTLKTLHMKQRTTIEDIKKKTNYYSTKSLIDRYDERRVR